VQFLEPRGANAGRSEEGSNAPYQGASFQGGNQQQQQPSYQQSNHQPNQQNYTRTNDDPFSTGGGPIEVSDDDLPF
ncbi:single-stranded DNA-binding protein, partial [Microvirga sp. 3-52]|nr:single-stranded DNA-binding protein [Microvirga sp. 3-52]